MEGGFELVYSIPPQCQINLLVLNINDNILYYIMEGGSVGDSELLENPVVTCIIFFFKGRGRRTR